MHTWESVEGMVHQWEEQDIGDPFIYENFKYDLTEFDNLPPVIPRFTFYLQNNLKPMIDYLKKMHDCVDIWDLQQEVKDSLKKENQSLKDTESKLIKRCQELDKRCNNLQEQLDRLGDRNDKLNKERYEKG